jgi:23S rRNA (guanosine2251-2'-O)-methyltransferase
MILVPLNFVPLCLYSLRMSQIIFGKNPVLEALSSGQSIEKVYILATLRGETEIKVRKLCKDLDIPLAKVPEVKLNDLSKKKPHQGLAAVISPVTYISFESLMEETIAKKGVIVIMDNVTDVRNIGAIARSSYYFGATGIVLSGNFSGQINEDTVKTSAGAILKIKISRISSLLTAMAEMQNLGLVMIAADVKGKKTPDQVDFTHPAAILLGAEEKGLHYKILENADEIAFIPGSGQFDSLNVSVAAGIMLYEAAKQK